MANVFIIDVNVNEIAQRILVIEEMAAQLSVRNRQLIESFTGGRRADFNLRLTASELPQRRWNNNGDWHIRYLCVRSPTGREGQLPTLALPHGRASDTISSSLNLDRS